jgi:prophage regulatory protein
MSQLLRLPQVLARVGLKTTRLYQLCGDGTFPAPIRIGKRAVAWDSAEVDSWIAARAAAPRVAIRTRSDTPKRKGATAVA